MFKGFDFGVNVFVAGDGLRINFLENPAHVNDDLWIPALAEAFCHAYNLRESSRNILQKAVKFVKSDLIDEVKRFRARSEGEGA